MDTQVATQVLYKIHPMISDYIEFTEDWCWEDLRELLQIIGVING